MTDKQEVQDLITECIMEVSYADKVTIAIPLYEKIKKALQEYQAVMDRVEDIEKLNSIIKENGYISMTLDCVVDDIKQEPVYKAIFSEMHLLLAIQQYLIGEDDEE